MFNRQFPPLYTPTGNKNIDNLAFFHILERLKATIILLTPHNQLTAIRHRNELAGLTIMSRLSIHSLSCLD